MCLLGTPDSWREFLCQGAQKKLKPRAVWVNRKQDKTWISKHNAMVIGQLMDIDDHGQPHKKPKFNFDKFYQNTFFRNLHVAESTRNARNLLTKDSRLYK